MKTLDEAWSWYQATKRNLARMQRLGDKHWTALGNNSLSLWHDDRFKGLEAQVIIAETIVSLEPIDDLAVVVLFSVFESHVRDHLAERIEPEAVALTEPILKDAAADAMRGVEEGSFYRRVLQPLKEQGRVSADLVTQVNQVREYRNWVAHGRRSRTAELNVVTPKLAFDRLNEFLAVLGIAADQELPPE